MRKAKEGKIVKLNRGAEDSNLDCFNGWWRSAREAYRRVSASKTE